MADEKAWIVRGNAKKSLKADKATATFVLRLGIAVTAIRAAHRLTVAVEDIQGPSAAGTRIWAFLLAVAYLHEAMVTAQPRFPKLKELALEAGATDELVASVGRTFAGKTDVGRAMGRLRNQLVFHFDEEAAQRWIDGYEEESVVWAEGSGPKTGNVLYRAATDVVAAGIVPDVTSDQGAAELRKLLNEVLEETDQVLRLFEHAIAGYLNSVDAQLEEESHS